MVGVQAVYNQIAYAEQLKAFEKCEFLPEVIISKTGTTIKHGSVAIKTSV